MNEMTAAILKDDADAVRRLVERDPGCRAVASESEWLPLDLSRRSGKTFCEMALLRLGAPSEVSPNFAEALVRAIRFLSETYTCAGWLLDVEYILWHVVTHEPPLPEEVDSRFAAMSQATREDLSYLAERCCGWPTWQSEPDVLPISEFLIAYDKWSAEKLRESQQGTW